jgi:hypothetical protein
MGVCRRLNLAAQYMEPPLKQADKGKARTWCMYTRPKLVLTSHPSSVRSTGRRSWWDDQEDEKCVNFVTQRALRWNSVVIIMLSGPNGHKAAPPLDQSGFEH